MTVNIKLLKGYTNPINKESNSLSLLVKSDYELEKHLKYAYEKILASLTCILKNIDKELFVYFYHKLSFMEGKNREFVTTRRYIINLDKLANKFNSSIDEVLKIDPKYISHFINITIKYRDSKKLYVFKPDEFRSMNIKIRSTLQKDGYVAKKSKNKCLFVDDEDVVQKKVDTKGYKNECLFVDDDDVVQKKVDTKGYKNECLFVDDDDVVQKKVDSPTVDLYDMKRKMHQKALENYEKLKKVNKTSVDGNDIVHVLELGDKDVRVTTHRKGKEEPNVTLYTSKKEYERIYGNYDECLFVDDYDDDNVCVWHEKKDDTKGYDNECLFVDDDDVVRH